MSRSNYSSANHFTNSSNNSKINKKENKTSNLLYYNILKSLNLKQCHFDVDNSGICFYCKRGLPNCGCHILPVNWELEGKSKDFELICIGGSGYDLVFNLDIAPPSTPSNSNYDIVSKVLFFNTSSKELLYRECHREKDGDYYFRNPQPRMYKPKDPYNYYFPIKITNDIKIIGVKVAELRRTYKTDEERKEYDAKYPFPVGRTRPENTPSRITEEDKQHLIPR